MDNADKQVEQLRRFNRTVTRSIGALQDRFLGRGRPLGESRLLYEIGAEGIEMRALRRRLDLDSGYASRLLRSLEREGFARSGPAPYDARVTFVRLTEKGVAERAELDRRSDAAMREILSGLDNAQRHKFTTAIEVVERLLRASETKIKPEPPSNPDAIWCLEQYYELLNERFEGGFMADPDTPAHHAEYMPPNGVFLVARCAGQPVGCIGLRREAPGIGEVKRLWVAETSRGTGLGQRLLVSAEKKARELGFTKIRLDTNATLTEAHALYLKNGYREIPCYNDNPYPDYWFEKRL